MFAAKDGKMNFIIIIVITIIIIIIIIIVLHTLKQIWIFTTLSLKAATYIQYRAFLKVLTV